MTKDHKLLQSAHEKIVEGEKLVAQADVKKSSLETRKKLAEKVNEYYPKKRLDQVEEYNISFFNSVKDIDKKYCANTQKNLLDTLILQEKKTKPIKALCIAIPLVLSILFFLIVGIADLFYETNALGYILLCVVSIVVLEIISMIIYAIVAAKKRNDIHESRMPSFLKAVKADFAVMLVDINSIGGIVKQVEEICDKITKTLDEVRDMDILPESYIDSKITMQLLKVFEEKEADTMKEAIQIYKRREEEKKRFEELQRHHYAMENLAVEQIEETQRLNSSLASIRSEMEEIKKVASEKPEIKVVAEVHTDTSGIQRQLNSINNKLG